MPTASCATFRARSRTSTRPRLRRRTGQAAQARHQEAAAGQRQAAPRALRRDTIEVRGDRPQLRRPREGVRQSDSRAPGRFLQIADLHRRPQRQHHVAARFDADRLGGRDRLRDRPHGSARAAQGRTQVRRRLLPDQRRLRARLPAEAERVPVEQGQRLRHVRTDRAVARHHRRDQGPPESRYVARRQRRAQANRQHQNDDLRRRRARRRCLEIHDAAARRRHHYRHAARVSAWA